MVLAELGGDQPGNLEGLWRPPARQWGAINAKASLPNDEQDAQISNILKKFNLV